MFFHNHIWIIWKIVLMFLRNFWNIFILFGGLWCFSEWYGTTYSVLWFYHHIVLQSVVRSYVQVNKLPRFMCLSNQHVISGKILSETRHYCTSETDLLYSISNAQHTTILHLSFFFLLILFWGSCGKLNRACI